MKCPSCSIHDLVMSERQGIEIDYCPKCRGIWLDRGELDKILERSQREFGLGAPTPASAPAAHTAGAGPVQQRYRSPDDSDIYPAQGAPHPHGQAPQGAHAPPPYYYKKRKHWLLELLD